MAPRFLFSRREWPQAVETALSYMNQSALDGEMRTVDFLFGPPSRGRLPFEILIDGRKTLRCELSDTDKTFLYDIREWLERSTIRDRNGDPHPECLTLDYRGGVLTFFLAHSGWDHPGSKRPTSYLIVLRHNRIVPAMSCFCDTFGFILGMYESMMACLNRYRDLFDDPACWYDVRRFDRLNPVPTSERLLSEFQSEKLEILCKSFRKK